MLWVCTWRHQAAMYAKWPPFARFPDDEVISAQLYHRLLLPYTERVRDYNCRGKKKTVPERAHFGSGIAQRYPRGGNEHVVGRLVQIRGVLMPRYRRQRIARCLGSDVPYRMSCYASLLILRECESGGWW